MAEKEDLCDWLKYALESNNGRATIVQVCKYIWEIYEDELRRSGDLFYTWQYDIRWAAHELRRSGMMKQTNLSNKGIWELAKPPQL